MNIGIWGWDEVDLPLISQWRKIHVNAVGDVQVDVGSSALPLGAASAANQVITNADLTTLIAEQGRCYGWDGDTWEKMLFEDTTYHNLRVKLYDGADGIFTYPINAYDIAYAATPALATFSKILLHGSAAVGSVVKQPIRILDNDTGYYSLPVFLWGYNGANWDRLRTYGTGILAVAKGAIQPTRTRVTATGRVGVAGAKTLFWIACSPDDPGGEWEITDADAGGGDVVYDHFDQDRSSEQLDFNPPMEFATGIWVEKFDHMKSLVFCYV